MSTSRNNNMFDVIIIGAGPVGLACGIEAQKHKLSYNIIEKGCIVNSIYNYPTNMTFFSTSDRLEIGDVPFVSHGIKPTRREALEYYRRIVDSLNLKVNVYERVLDIDKHPNYFVIKTTKRFYKSRNLIFATGFYDNEIKLNVPGEDLPKVHHYFNEAHPYAFMKVCVLGAGNSAVDVALECYRTGAEVTMIVREPDLKSSVKYWVKPDIKNRIKEGEIKAYFESTVSEITLTDITFYQRGKKITIKNDYVFAMTGYIPDLKLPEKLGVKVENGLPVFNKKTHSTNIDGIYLAGVICGGIFTDRYYIENSLDQPHKIISHIIKH
ncbi:MAG: YpdA family putative bacillithiol disulfide reductase [Ignavibacteria bacterium]|nr:Ferredoxin--NADP reductase [Ignavibacteria bacterium]